MNEHKWLLNVTGYVDSIEFEGTPEDAFNTLMNEVLGYLENSCEVSVKNMHQPLGLYRKLEAGEEVSVIIDFKDGQHTIAVKRVED